jgi:hypothetical protein
MPGRAPLGRDLLNEPSGLILERMFDCDMPVVDAQPIVSDQSRLKECRGSFGTDSSAVGGGLSAEARHLQAVVEQARSRSDGEVSVRATFGLSLATTPPCREGLVMPS